MASQAVRALIVVEGRGICHEAFCAPAPDAEAPAAGGAARERLSVAALRPLHLIFAAARTKCRIVLALLAFIACASIQHLAQASANRLWTPADFATSAGDDRALDRSAPEPAHYHQTKLVPPVRELNAIEPQDIEEDAGPDAPALSLSVHFAPIAPLSSHGPCVAAPTRMAQFSVSSALPRGPPSIRR